MALGLVIRNRKQKLKTTVARNGGLVVVDVQGRRKHMTAQEAKFLDDIADKVRVRLQPDFEAGRKHTTTEVEKVEKALGAKIDDSAADIKRIIKHLGI